MTNKEIYKEALFKSSVAFAYHEAIFDEWGNFIDYRFLDVNDAFCESTGFTREQVIGKCFVKDLSLSQEEGMKWVNIYEPVVRTGKEKIIESYSQDLKSNFFVHAYSPHENHFVTLFKNTTNEYKIERITTYFLEHAGTAIDFQLLTKMGLEFSGADYALFNLYEENDCYVTKSILGVPETLEKIMKILGVKLIGKRYPRSHDYRQLLSNTSVIEFEDLSSIIGNSIPKTTLRQIQKMFGIGKVVIAEVKKDDQIYGNFTLIYNQDSTFTNSAYLNIYLKQLGVFIAKCQLEKTLGIKELEAEVLNKRMRKDILTNAYNRSAISTLLNDRLILASRNKIKCYFIILDIDNFKIMNDNYGHQLGDKILQMFVDRINASIRKNDLLVRIGGDEFLLYLEDIKTDTEADQFMQRFFEILNKSYFIHDEESGAELQIEMSLSAGAARFPKDGQNVKDLMSKADYTMYKVKKTGKNDFAFFALNKATE